METTERGKKLTGLAPSKLFISRNAGSQALTETIDHPLTKL